MNSSEIWAATLAARRREHAWWLQVLVMFEATRENGRKGVVIDD